MQLNNNSRSVPSITGPMLFCSADSLFSRWSVAGRRTPILFSVCVSFLRPCLSISLSLCYSVWWIVVVCDSVSVVLFFCLFVPIFCSFICFCLSVCIPEWFRFCDSVLYLFVSIFCSLICVCLSVSVCECVFVSLSLISEFIGFVSVH